MRTDAWGDSILRADKQLIELFLVGYNRLVGDKYAVQEWPDETERLRPAVDAIAGNARGLTIAIEHSLIQPYFGEKDDTQIFHRVFFPLQTDPSLKFSEYDIELCPKVGAVPKGVDWDEAGKVIRQWVASEAGRFPVGESVQQIRGLPFEINVLVLKSETVLGQVFVGRSGMPETFKTVIRTAFLKKLPKLVSCEASRRILLFEEDSTQYGSAQIASIVEALELEFPHLVTLHEIWVADTVSQESGDLRFCQVWPGGVTRRVYVRRNPAGTIKVWQRRYGM